jgi:hypothetical protein
MLAKVSQTASNSASPTSSTPEQAPQQVVVSTNDGPLSIDADISRAYFNEPHSSSQIVSNCISNASACIGSNMGDVKACIRSNIGGGCILKLAFVSGATICGIVLSRYTRSEGTKEEQSVLYGSVFCAVALVVLCLRECSKLICPSDGHYGSFDDNEIA